MTAFLPVVHPARATLSVANPIKDQRIFRPHLSAKSACFQNVAQK
ncbi:MAG TPA: hypothetical protein VF409_06500 [Sphingomonas sp.]